jgi:cardiolipin synthase (CMP-forming)
MTSLPNLLTLSRILVVPALVAGFYLHGVWAKWATCILFTAAALTDYLDGYLARSWRQQSSFGRFLDPIADKLLVMAAIVMLVSVGRAPVLPSLVILAREILVSGLREFLAELRVSLPVSRLAKWKTAVQMGAIALLLLGEAAPVQLPAAEIGWFGLWLAAALTLVTGYDYLRAGLRHMPDDQAAPAKPQPVTQARSSSPLG